MEDFKLNDFFKQHNLVKVAWYYYIEGITQQEIADIMGVSRMKINKMLDEARQKNIIQFFIPVAARNKLELEKELINMFNLQDAFVVPVSTDNNMNEALGKAAAIYVNNMLQTNSYINMGYGDTLHHFISYLSSITDKPVSVVSLTGGIDPYLPTKNSYNFNVNLNLIPAPLFMNSKESADNILLEKSVQEVFELSELSSITITGVGEVSNNSTIVKTGILTTNEVKKMQVQGAVADILMHFIDKDGNLIESEIEDRVVSRKLDTLKNMKNVIAVAGGESKTNAILAALKTGIFKVLITSEEDAKKIIERSKNDE
ncbi:sugar-binding transcriptional regulator [Fundicoccus culcitae]|uniref:Sugar-binding transcriptional regulator n=1 Tax=Fundicoccus culcitae TaxID=2969821 RepID=A0ABY5P482_9LACT|nr:sugar-binding transcriptional regulator [Fundicoccus culcitae]UUX33542.1 sugar-binding transcriptional regulator [Fundicoccus culcitae]